MNNIAQLITSAAAAVPHTAFGTFQQQDRLDRVVERARTVAALLAESGLVAATSWPWSATTVARTSSPGWPRSSPVCRPL
ncbi:hypothetical protein LP414_08385 [Polaromonas sp. P1(28)-13]|nr:hypothetical protein LP414_08385 [Polaromonas sp. P1(28)-13]